jgi:hypothetical protein
MKDLTPLAFPHWPFLGRNRRKEMARLWHALSRFDMAKEKSRNHVVAQALKFGRTLYERN